MRKNVVVIDVVRLFIDNFNGTGMDYQVYAYAQDIDEGDMYGIEITPFGDDGELDMQNQWVMYADSSGNTTEDIPNDDISRYVMDLLFVKREHGIIRGF